MPETDATCRICRGEASSTQPLIHPCRCRGSIKYIHQECLLEWLEHSNNKAKRCDICNTPYRFVTLYDPDMPATMPAKEIYQRLVLSARDAVVKHVSAALYVACVCQVPVFWKLVGRLCTYAVDGKMPSPDYSLFHVMAYGAYSRTRNGHLFASPEATALEKLQTFFFNTYLNGLLQVTAFVFVLFVIFIEHEWVVREEGYTKSLLRQIGKEPKTKLADLLGQIIQNGAEIPRLEQPADAQHDAQVARETLAAHALEYIQQDPRMALPENRLREALENGQFAELRHGFAADHRAVPGTGVMPNVAALNEPQVPENAHSDSASSSQHATASEGEASSFSDIESEDEDADTSHNLVGAGNGIRAQAGPQVGVQNGLESGLQNGPETGLQNGPETGLQNGPQVGLQNGPQVGLQNGPETGPQNEPQHPGQEVPNLQPALAADPNQRNTANDDSDDETAEELERRRNIAEDEMAVAEAANNNANIFEVLGLQLHIATPIQLTFLVDVAALVLLFVVYFIPHMMGSFVALVSSYVLVGVHGAFLVPLSKWLPVVQAQSAFSAVSDLQFWSHPKLLAVGGALRQHFSGPIVKLVGDVFALERTEPPSYTARGAFLAIGYMVVCFAIHQLMAALTLGKSPVTGAARRMFKVLFQITATAKVFAIFAIEIVLFPVYCGWLIDFCLAPLFVADIVSEVKGVAGLQIVYQIYVTSAYAFTSNFVVRFFLFWIWGTAYMFCIAMFVSMARNHILRPGVLYFIKSPEDPNARLIHDAVVKPFFLQMSRIFLSAKVYTAFVILGVGGVTWGIRFLVNPPGSNGALLPIKQFSLFTGQFALGTGITLFKAEPLISKYCRLFWKRAFAVLCHKLRLSHFVLGSPVPQERGHVVYKSLVDRVLQMSVPDYTKPVSYSEAMEIFQVDPAVTACFVPDGHYLRAPSSDDNSRKFLRELFVPVTKSDQLLAPMPDTDLDDDTDWWDAEVVCEDTYTVVYSPPSIRLRCLALVCMISLFGALVFVVASLLAVILGRPAFRALLVIMEFNSSLLGYDLKYSQSTNWSFADVNSLCLGLLMQLSFLVVFDAETEGSAIVNFAAEQGRRLAEPAMNARGFLVRAGVFLAHKLLQVWFFAEMHFLYINTLEMGLFNTSMISSDGDHILLRFTWAGLAMHSSMALLTFVPLFTTLSLGMPETASFKTWGGRVGLVELSLGMAIVLSHKAFEALQGELSVQASKTANMVVVALVVILRLAMNARKLLTGISEQIKTEKYVRGTAVQNIDVEEEQCT